MSDSLALPVGGLFALALGLALALTPLAARAAACIGLVDKPGARKIHSQVMPYGGGLAIFASVALTAALAFAAGHFFCAPGGTERLPPWLTGTAETARPYFEGAALAGPRLRSVAIALGAAAMFLLGLVDDLRNLSPRIKLAVQILAAALVAFSGTRLSLFVANPWVGGTLTVLWIVFITNAFNLLDNMDGLSAGVALVASGLFCLIALQGEQVLVAGALAVLTGALLGFLRYNFAPARLFMGDAGALLVGFLLATLTVAGSYYDERGGWASLAAPLLVLGVPIFDTLSVICIRLKRGKPIFQGDTNHFSHRLVRLGMTRREAVLSIYLLGMILGGAATLLRRIGGAGGLTLLLLGAGILVFVALLENAAARREDG